MTGSTLLEQIGAIAWPLAALAPGCALLWIGSTIFQSITSDIFALIIGFSGYALLYTCMLFLLRRKLIAGDLLNQFFFRMRRISGDKAL